ncbi:MAG TPA: hypothetical protein VEZ48_05615 [Sphingomonadaceae bacterium]|nr:hypothetical protein [Sphingomonadaceae bacterium]
MIVALLIAMERVPIGLPKQMAAPAPANAEVQREIVVIGSKLKTWRARVYEKRGKMLCDTGKSTGDKAIDAIGCTAMATCLTELKPRLMANLDRKLPAAERKSAKAVIDKDLGACVMSRRDAMTADLADRRWRARQGNTNAPN